MSLIKLQLISMYTASQIDVSVNAPMAGKIVVYPMLHDLDLISLAQLSDRFPSVAAKLDGGQWCKAAEQELLQVASGAGGAA